MNIDFNINTFLNIIENIFSNNIVTYIIPKKDNLNKFGKILPICNESHNHSEKLVQDLLDYESLNYDKYKFKYDIENGLYDIEIGYISLMEDSYSKNNINEKSNLYEYNKDNFNNTHIIDCFNNEDI
jgi:hypothetical protein